MLHQRTCIQGLEVQYNHLVHTLHWKYSNDKDNEKINATILYKSCFFNFFKVAIYKIKIRSRPKRSIDYWLRAENGRVFNVQLEIYKHYWHSHTSTLIRTVHCKIWKKMNMQIFYELPGLKQVNCIVKYFK